MEEDIAGVWEWMDGSRLYRSCIIIIIIIIIIIYGIIARNLYILN